MKRSIISAAVLSVVFMSAGAFAADTDQGELIITGRWLELPVNLLVIPPRLLV
jgi:type 1 fimbria pilin